MGLQMLAQLFREIAHFLNRCGTFFPHPVEDLIGPIAWLLVFRELSDEFFFG